MSSHALHLFLKGIETAIRMPPETATIHPLVANDFVVTIWIIWYSPLSPIPPQKGLFWTSAARTPDPPKTLFNSLKLSLTEIDAQTTLGLNFYRAFCKSWASSFLSFKNRKDWTFRWEKTQSQSTENQLNDLWFVTGIDHSVQRAMIWMIIAWSLISGCNVVMIKCR